MCYNVALHAYLLINKLILIFASYLVKGYLCPRFYYYINPDLCLLNTGQAGVIKIKKSLYK